MKPIRKTRSRHPGVFFKERKHPTGEVRIRAIYKDPDTGKRVYKTLDPGAFSAPKHRTGWAAMKSKQLMQRKREIEMGLVRPKKESPIAAVIAAYLTPRKPGLKPKPRTLARYGVALRTFEAWAARQRIRYTEYITPDDLGTFRRAVFDGGRQPPVKGGKRGERRLDSGGTRSPSTINSDLNSLRIALKSWRAEGLTPLLSKDEISDRLKGQRVELGDPEFLTPPQVRKLIAACQAHDAATFAETRAEHTGRGTVGTTPRHAPILPYTLFLLFSGCRRGEPLALQWSDVDLDARNSDGSVVGEIRIPARVTKTGRSRIVGLEVSRALRSILIALRPENGEGPIFPGYTAETIERSRTYLVKRYGAPEFTWQGLRSTCATYLTCSTGIWGSATVFLSARQLGHTVAIAERHYLNVLRGIDKHATTLEAAMQCEALLGGLAGADRPS